jgi:hypothetical protein
MKWTKAFPNIAIDQENPQCQSDLLSHTNQINQTSQMFQSHQNPVEIQVDHKRTFLLGPHLKQ